MIVSCSIKQRTPGWHLVAAGGGGSFARCCRGEEAPQHARVYRQGGPRPPFYLSTNSGGACILLKSECQNAKMKPKLSVQQKGALHRRHRVENFFCRLDKFKRLLVRHDRCISSFQSFHFLAFAVIMSRQLEREPLSFKVA